MNTVLTFLQRHGQRLSLEGYGPPEHLSWVMITPRFRASRHVVFIILPRGQTEPVLVAKVPRLAGTNTNLVREAANLRHIQASRPGGFDSIPQVIAFEEYCQRPILIETALVGQPIDPAAVRADLAGCCTAVADWLIELQQSTSISAEADVNWFYRLVEQPLRYFEQAFPLSFEEERLLEQTWQLVAPLRNANLPLVFEHGDLSHPNLIRLKNNRLGVLDWELAEPRGLPGYDLFFFLTYVAFALNKANSTGNYLTAFHQAFFDRAAWAYPYIKGYAEQIELPLVTLSPLFVLTWLRYLVSLLTRLGDGEKSAGRLGADTTAWLRTNRYYTLWRYTLTHINDLNGST